METFHVSSVGKAAQRLDQEYPWKEESTFNNQTQLKQSHRKQTAHTRNLGEGPMLGKGEKRAQSII